ncbi:MAG: hypothetical protein ABSH22_21900 [Tepidisphaeraceae bacterium]
MLSRQLVCALAAALIAADVPRLFAAPATQPSSTPSTPGLESDLFAANPILVLDDDDDDNAKPAKSPNSNETSGRYFLGLLDHRSSYGKDFFPDPFLGPEFDSEQQIELDYAHADKRGVRDDEIDAGFQWNVIGELTVAGEFGWDSEHRASTPGSSDGGDEDAGGSGFENVDLAAYHPVFQYVSQDAVVDYTAAARLDVGVPTRTPVSGDDAQLTPYLGQLLRIGEHVSIEAWTGAQFTIAPREVNQLIYGALLGYELSHDQLPVPLTQRITPNLEFDGQSPFSGGGQDALFGVAGVDINLKPIGEVQPTLQVGYEFPVDQGARDQLHWGILAEFMFEF